MSFVLVVYAVFLITLTIMKYKRMFSVAVVITFLFLSITAVLLYGLQHFDTASSWHVFGKDIEQSTFIHLLVVLYGVNIICAAIIIRNYRDYRKVNRG
ncbi:MAG TPA: hypothetical protein PK926_13040 [Spirochaetota bacterium]|nr:hypothetical protein [Spirochaetota bacterium]HPI89560.1 hypothetical protein [Spirochaetota bacterium]HPR49024.1 hypothetical protein [Spirochaetota bacterium]